MCDRPEGDSGVIPLSKKGVEVWFKEEGHDSGQSDEKLCREVWNARLVHLAALTDALDGDPRES